MKHKSAEEILDERCKENNITFISAYYMQKGLSLPEEGSNDANVFKMAILSAMEAYRFQPSQEVKELPSLEELIKIVFDSNVNILIPDCKGDLEVHIASKAIEIVKQLASVIIAKKDEEIKFIKGQANSEIKHQEDMLKGQYEKIGSLESELTKEREEKEELRKDLSNFDKTVVKMRVRELESELSALRKENEQLKSTTKK